MLRLQITYQLFLVFIGYFSQPFSILFFHPYFILSLSFKDILCTFYKGYELSFDFGYLCKFLFRIFRVTEFLSFLNDMGELAFWEYKTNLLKSLIEPLKMLSEVSKGTALAQDSIQFIKRFKGSGSNEV